MPGGITLNNERKVVLKNGIEETESMVRGTMRDLRKLWEEEPDTFRDFFHKCRNRSHSVAVDHLHYLVERGFCLRNQQPDPRIQNILRCAVSEDGQSFRIRSPLKD